MKKGFLQKKNVPEKKKEKQQPVRRKEMVIERKEEDKQLVLRKEEIKKEESGKNGVDRLSSMPEDVLHHIFSFVKMKQAVQTCVLSTKWRKFWVSIPTITFDDQFWLDKKGILKKDAVKDFVSIMQGLINAKSLTLSLEGIQGFAGTPNMLKRLPKSFPNLKYLKLKEWRTDLYSDGLAKLFQIFPCIETLVIEKAVVNPDMYSENKSFGFQVNFCLSEAMEDTYGPTNKGDWDKFLAPKSVFQKLRLVEIHNPKCTDNEFDFVGYLLKTAKVLENMKITTIKPRSRSKWHTYDEFGKKIESLPRASSGAKLSFVVPKNRELAFGPTGEVIPGLKYLLE